MKLASIVSKLLHVVLLASITLVSASKANGEFAVPPLTGRVVDAGSVFTPEESAQIESAILRLESTTGGQMVVTTLPSLEGLSIEEVGIRLGDTWKIGSKEEDNGAILIIVVPERKMRLEVGIGWEGAINDARAGDVIRGLAPFFRENKYADGAVWAVESVQQYVTGKEVDRTVSAPASAAANTDNTESGTEENSLLYTILGVFCSIPLFALLFYCLWAIFVYAVIMPIWLLLYLIFALCGKELPVFDPASLLGLGFLADWGDGSSSSDSSSCSSSSYSCSSSSSSSSHYSGGGGSFGGGGASGGW